MDMSGNSSNEASDSDDSFDESNRRYEEIILCAGHIHDLSERKRESAFQMTVHRRKEGIEKNDRLHGAT